MNYKTRIFLWCIVFFIGYVAMSKLDDWARKEDAKHQPVFHYNPYITHS
jgi:hypothetical protein